MQYNALTLSLLGSFFVTSSPIYAQSMRDCGNGTAQSRILSCSQIINNRNVSLRDRAIAYDGRCWALNSIGDHRSALADCNAALQLYPDYAFAYNNRGVARSALGDREAAIADFRRALQLRSNFAVAAQNLQETLANVSQAPPGGRQYTLSGFRLLTPITDADLASFQCSQSESYPRLRFCTKTEKSGRYSETTSLLIDEQRKPFYINNSGTHASVDQTSIDDEIRVLIGKHGPPADTKKYTSPSDRSSAHITHWGDLRLTSLPEDALQRIADGQPSGMGLLVDFQGNFRKSVMLKSPVFYFESGRGVVWTSQRDALGRGSFRVMVIDASYLSAERDTQKLENTSPAVSSQPSEGPSTALDRSKADPGKSIAVADERSGKSGDLETRRLEEAEKAERLAKLEEWNREQERLSKVQIEQAKLRLEEERRRRFDEARQKGIAYASTTSLEWDVSKKMDEMTDKIAMTISSLHKSTEGIAVAELIGTCDSRSAKFVAKVFKSDDGEGIRIVGSPIKGDLVKARRRIDDMPANETMLPTEKFFNQFIIATYTKDKSQHLLNSNSLDATILNNAISEAYGYVGDLNWRVLVQIETGHGSVLIRLPLFDKHVRQLIDECNR